METCRNGHALSQGALYVSPNGNYRCCRTCRRTNTRQAGMRRRSGIKPKAPVSFWSNIRYDENTGCWNWTGAKNKQGYGQMHYLGKVRLVHRLSAHFYKAFDLDSPLFIMHSCDNPSCFNPKHLSPGNNQENLRQARERGLMRYPNKEKTHCHKGHPYEGENLYVTKKGFRQCKACHADRQKARKCQ